MHSLGVIVHVHLHEACVCTMYMYSRCMVVHVHEVCVMCIYMYSGCMVVHKESYETPLYIRSTLYIYDVIFIIRFFRKYQNKTNLKNG